jgi:hypothetical protein
MANSSDKPQSQPIDQPFYRDILERLKIYDEYGPLSCVALHPETPGYTTGMLLRDARDARTEIDTLRRQCLRYEGYIMSLEGRIKKAHAALGVTGGTIDG